MQKAFLEWRVTINLMRNERPWEMRDGKPLTKDLLDIKRASGQEQFTATFKFYTLWKIEFWKQKFNQTLLLVFMMHCPGLKVLWKLTNKMKTYGWSLHAHHWHDIHIEQSRKISALFQKITISVYSGLHITVSDRQYHLKQNDIDKINIKW